jgi:hypothetical protein
LLPKEYLDVDRIMATRDYDYDLDEFDKRPSIETVRPCMNVSGERVSSEKDMTNLTFRRHNPGIAELYLQRQNRSPNAKKKPPRKRVYKDIDALHTLPMHDFRQADRAVSNWIPHNCPDPDQDRLVQFLAYAARADPLAVRQSMLRILRHQKL